jgi:curved DNA-binding protein CbpA
MKSKKKYLNEMLEKIITDNNNSSILLNENMYELLGVPHDFDPKNEDHVKKLKNNYKALSRAAHPDKLRGMDKTKISEIENAFRHVRSAHDFLLNGGQISGGNASGHLGLDDNQPRPNLSPADRLSRTRFFRHEMDGLLDRAHGGNHWRPQEFKDFTKHPSIIAHLTDWYKNATSNREHHDRVIASFASPGGTSTSSTTSGRQQKSQPTESTVKPSMSRPPLKHQDTLAQQLHRALGDANTFIDEDHNPLSDGNVSGMPAPYRHFTHSPHNVDLFAQARTPMSPIGSSFVYAPEHFKTKNKALKTLHSFFWNTHPSKRGFGLPRAHNTTDTAWPNSAREMTGAPAHLDTHHLSMVLHPDYARRALASAHSSHVNFRKNHIERTGVEPTDHELQAAIDQGIIRSPHLPIEEEGQRQVLRHIHAMQTLAIDNPKVHMNDLIGILTRPTEHTSHTGNVTPGYSGVRRSGVQTLTPAEEQQEANRSLVWSAARKLRLGLVTHSGEPHPRGPNAYSRTQHNDYAFVRPSETSVVDWYERQRANYVGKPGFESTESGTVKMTDPIQHHHFHFSRGWIGRSHPDEAQDPTLRVQTHPLLTTNFFHALTGDPAWHRMSEDYKAKRQREDEGIKALLETHPDPLVRGNMTSR